MPAIIPSVSLNVSTPMEAPGYVSSSSSSSPPSFPSLDQLVPRVDLPKSAYTSLGKPELQETLLPYEKIYRGLILLLGMKGSLSPEASSIPLDSTSDQLSGQPLMNKVIQGHVNLAKEACVKITPPTTTDSTSSSPSDPLRLRGSKSLIDTYCNVMTKCTNGTPTTTPLTKVHDFHDALGSPNDFLELKEDAEALDQMVNDVKMAESLARSLSNGFTMELQPHDLQASLRGTLRLMILKQSYAPDAMPEVRLDQALQSLH
ncbi:MAG: hypothetical protein DHS80DRAFT_29078, partial [Piptocephalis tieghemiana]